MELGNNYEGFQAFYENFLHITQQINLQNFVTIGAEDKYDNVSCAFEIIDHIFRELSHIEYQAIKEHRPKVQLILHDCFSCQKSIEHTIVFKTNALNLSATYPIEHCQIKDHATTTFC